MTLSENWQSRGVIVGWTAFVVLSLPALFFAIRLGLSEGFNFGKASATVLSEAAIGIVCWALGHGFSRGSPILIIAASVFVTAILIAYGAAISLLVGGLGIKVF